MAIEWCVVLSPKQEGKSRAALLDDAKWRHNRITVSFLDGDTALRDRVRAAAEQWITATGIPLRFEWRKDTTDTDIRISFAYSGSWSHLGRYSADVSGPSMNFGWLHASSTEEEVREVVLHEFGHALGLIHEHQNPDADIPWDEEAVRTSLRGPPNNWDDATIDHNVLANQDRKVLSATPYDPSSIMHYPFPPEWRHDRKPSQNNTTLSDSDIALIRRVYGRPGHG